MPHNSSEKVIEIAERETGQSGITEATSLDSLGLDSLEFVSLIQMVVAEVGSIDKGKIASMNTIGDIVKAIH